MARKLHLEIMPANWKRMKRHIKAYNEDPDRVTPRIKYGHVINKALDGYLPRERAPAAGQETRRAAPKGAGRR